MDNNTIQEQLETIFSGEKVPATPNGALAIIWMDTAYRLAGMLLSSQNRARAKDGLPALSPSLKDLQKGLLYIGSFDTYFCEAVDDDKGEPCWIPGDKHNLRSIAYSMYSDLTSKLIEHADDLKEVKLGYTAQGIFNERNKGDLFLPDMSGIVMTDFAQPVASKVAFYAYRLITILRANGGSREFAPKSASTLTDVLNAREVTILDAEEQRDDPVEIDHFDMDWDLTSTEKLTECDVFELNGKELDDARNTREALEAWFRVYERIEDGNEALRDEITYQVARAKEWVENNRKQSHSPVSGTVVAKS